MIVASNLNRQEIEAKVKEYNVVAYLLKSESTLDEIEKKILSFLKTKKKGSK